MSALFSRIGKSTSMRLKAVLVDLSGTLHIQDNPIPGAVEALCKLQSQKNIRLRFVTNTTKESARSLLSRLTALGFDLQASDIFSSLAASHRLLVERNLRPYLMVDEAALEDFADIPQDNPNAVVIGLAPQEMTYTRMNTAMRLILNGSPLIAIHKGRFYKQQDGLSLGPGPFVKALEFATGVESEIVGKPTKSFFLSAIKDLECRPEECVMIGDDVRDDIEGAQDVGMKGMLVQTGKYRHGDENEIKPQPYKVVTSFVEAVEEILNMIHSNT